MNFDSTVIVLYYHINHHFQVRGIEGKSICAFSSRDAASIVVVCADGNFIVSSFEEGGECPRITTKRFMNTIHATGDGSNATTNAVGEAALMDATLS